jgi:hypothetical protein
LSQSSPFGVLEELLKKPAPLVDIIAYKRTDGHPTPIIDRKAA